MTDPLRTREELLLEAEGLCRRLWQLVVAINRANSRVWLSDGRTLTEALAERDTLKLWQDFPVAMAGAAFPSRDRELIGSLARCGRRTPPCLTISTRGALTGPPSMRGW